MKQFLKFGLFVCMIVVSVLLLCNNTLADVVSSPSTKVVLLPPQSKWINQRGSTMLLNVDTLGNLSGTYQTNVGCGKGKSRPLVGFQNQYGITFTVNFQECLSTTAWSGTIDNKNNTLNISTLWYLANGSQPPSFTSLLAGQDTFQQIYRSDSKSSEILLKP
jgi:hypothetical protein